MDSKQEREVPKTIKAQEVLDDAQAIRQNRGAIYGDPYLQMDRCAKLWTAYLGVPITAHDVAIIYALGKFSRIAETQGSRNRDSYTDIASYSALALQLATTDPYDAYDEH